LLDLAELGRCGGFTIRTKENQLVFDPDSAHTVQQGSTIFISHAHADHFTGLKSKSQKYSTAETRKIFENLHNRSVINFHDTRIKQPIKFGDIEVTPINAGHMLGSTQFLATLPDITILYTGDINYLDTLTTKKAERVECDVLVMEATYGEPSYIFPEREEIYANIVKWTVSQIKKGLVPIFHVYAAGKAQELVRLFNIYTNLDVATDPRIARVNEVYSESGLRLDYREMDGEAEEEACVIVTTQPSGLLSARKHVKAMATGWALKMNMKRVAAFPLSSHADFSQLLQFVKDCKAKVVYGFTGQAEVFADQLKRKLGIPSRPLPALGQKSLQDLL